MYITSILQKYSRQAGVPKYLRGSHFKDGGIKYSRKIKVRSVYLFMLVVVPCVFFGGLMGKQLAYILEVSEIFMPEDDYDDND